MRLKYYLRGLAVGIIVTTLILTVSFSLYKPTMSDEEIMVRATDLGMVMSHSKETDDTENYASPEEVAVTASSDDLEAAQGAESYSGTGNNDETVPSQDADEGSQRDADTYRLSIERGEVARDVCTRLEEAGVVSNGEELRMYLYNTGAAKNLAVGHYDIPYGLSMEEVAAIISDPNPKQ
jgi:hypothetical protein